jgi:hypothetical protein
MSLGNSDVCRVQNCWNNSSCRIWRAFEQKEKKGKFLASIKENLDVVGLLHI